MSPTPTPPLCAEGTVHELQPTSRESVCSFGTTNSDWLQTITFEFPRNYLFQSFKVSFPTESTVLSDVLLLAPSSDDGFDFFFGCDAYTLDGELVPLELRYEGADKVYLVTIYQPGLAGWAPLEEVYFWGCSADSCDEVCHAASSSHVAYGMGAWALLASAWWST